MIARAAAVALTVLVLAGCEATVSSELTVTGPDAVEATATVTLTGAAAEAFGDDPQLLARLEDLVTRRAGVAPARERDGDRLSWTAAVPVDRLTAASGLTGLGAVTVTDDGAGRAAVTLSLVPPSELRAALETGDDPAAAEQLLANTFVEVRLAAGVVESVTGLQSSQDPEVTVSVDERSVTITRPVSSAAAGELSAVASPASSFPALAVVGAAVLVCVAAVVVWAVRRTGPGRR